MKTLDYFYEEVVCPAVERAVEIARDIAIFIANALIMVVLWITLPIWIIPYFIIKKKGADDERN